MKKYLIASAWSGHDSNFAISDEDGNILLHAEHERFSRIRTSRTDAVQFMLDTYPDSDKIKYFGIVRPINKLSEHKKSFDKIQEIVKNNDGKMFVIGHHTSHASAAFFESNFEESLILTLDGGGVEEDDLETACAMWYGKGNKLVPLKIIPSYKINIGGLWSRTTRYIWQSPNGGLGEPSSEGTVMCLPAFSKNPGRFLNDFNKMLGEDLLPASMKPQGQPAKFVKGTDPVHPYLDKWVRLAKFSKDNEYDLAAALQTATETHIKEILRHALEIYPGKVKNLCLSGGVVLNSVAMGKIKLWFPEIEGIYICPCVHDGAMALGAVHTIAHNALDKPRVDWKGNFSAYLGHQSSKEEIMSALERFKSRVEWKETTDEQVVDLLVNNKIVAVHGGRAESGKRALGDRSILGNPMTKENRDYISIQIKGRAAERPIAPSILREDVKEWFVNDVESPYMSFVIPFKKEVVNKVPVVAHADLTGRLQTVREEDNKWYYNFLKKWKEKTGVGMIANTSWNENRPICNTAFDSLECMLDTKVDYLYFYDVGLLVNVKK